MKKRIYNHVPLLTAVISLVLIFFIIFFIELEYLSPKEQDIKLLKILEPSNIILYLTLGAIVWYSLETKLLKNATNIANAINAEPFVVLQYRKQKAKDKLFIINYGKGVAFNVSIKKIKNIQGFFNYSIENPNPMGYLEEKVLLGNQENNQNIVAEITLSFYKSEGDKIVERERKYEIKKVANGWQIKLMGQCCSEHKVNRS